MSFIENTVDTSMEILEGNLIDKKTLKLMIQKIFNQITSLELEPVKEWKNGRIFYKETEERKIVSLVYNKGSFVTMDIEKDGDHTFMYLYSGIVMNDYENGIDNQELFFKEIISNDPKEECVCFVSFFHNRVFDFDYQFNDIVNLVWIINDLDIVDKVYKEER